MIDPDYAAPDVWRELFFQAPASYQKYLGIWEKYQAPPAFRAGDGGLLAANNL